MLPSSPTRFLSKITKTTNGCWLWQAGLTRDGYGQFYYRDGRNGYAHRFSYEYYKGPIPDGLHIDHLCRTRRCVNPDHLEVVTQRTNNLRGTAIPAKNARKTHCKRGHPLSGTNLRIIETKKLPQRRCGECNRIACQKRRDALKAKIITPE